MQISQGLVPFPPPQCASRWIAETSARFSHTCLRLGQTQNDGDNVTLCSYCHYVIIHQRFNQRVRARVSIMRERERELRTHSQTRKQFWTLGLSGSSWNCNNNNCNNCNNWMTHLYSTFMWKIGLYCMGIWWWWCGHMCVSVCVCVWIRNKGFLLDPRDRMTPPPPILCSCPTNQRLLCTYTTTICLFTVLCTYCLCTYMAIISV